MGFIIDFIEKFIGFHKFVAIALIALRVTFFSALLVFLISVGVAYGKAYIALDQIFDYFFASSLGGVAGSNDINSVAWTLLSSIGILDVFSTFVPIVFSTIVSYLTLFLTGMLLNFKNKVIKALYDSAKIYL